MKDEINDLELKIAKFLRVGVIVAGAIMLVGWVMKFKLHGNVFVNFETYDKLSLITLLKHHYAIKDWGVLLSYGGLFALISLPLIRVILTAYLFFRQKEFILAGIATFVFTALIMSMCLGIDL